MQRLGKLQEERDEQARLAEELLLAEERRLAEERQTLLATSMGHDQKWLRLEENRRRADLQLLVVERVQLKHHPLYTLAHPCPAEREHPLSWKLRPYNQHGLPLNETAAIQV